MKKVISVVEFIIGGVLLLIAVLDIPKIIGAFVGRSIAYALGGVLGVFLFGYFGFWLIRHGRKNWNPPTG